MTKKKLFLLVTIFLLLLIMAGGTFAYFQWRVSNDEKTEISLTFDKDFSCSVDGGGDITNNDALLAPATCTSEYAIQRTITTNVDIKRSDAFVFMDLWLDVNSVDTALLSSGNFKYAITTNPNSCADDVVNQGVIDASTESLFTEDLYFSSGSKTYYLYIWLDAAEMSTSTMNKNFNISLNGECQSEIAFTTQPITDYISSMYAYASKTVVTNDTVKYNYAPLVSLMNDRLGGTTENFDDGNIRYYGATPDNYVYFNCEDYSAQSDETCEIWRIIGLFKDVDDGLGNIADRVKIVRGTSLGAYTLDTTPSNVNSGYGTNDWSVADLGKMLNPGNDEYQNYNSASQLVTLNNSLYWNKTNGYCYNGRSNSVGTCDFRTTGMTDASKSMIGDTLYYLGSFGDKQKALMTGTYVAFMDEFHAHEMYRYERSDDVNECSDVLDDDGNCVRPTEWVGKIALMYPSDYIYATDFNLCGYDGISFGWSNWSHDSSGFVTDVCYANDWLHGTTNEWLLSPHNTPVYRSFTIQNGKYIYGAYNWRQYEVRPTLYLKSDVLITAGLGTISYPYQLSYTS